LSVDLNAPLGRDWAAVPRLARSRSSSRSRCTPRSATTATWRSRSSGCQDYGANLLYDRDLRSHRLAKRYAIQYSMQSLTGERSIAGGDQTNTPVGHGGPRYCCTVAWRPDHLAGSTCCILARLREDHCCIGPPHSARRRRAVSAGLRSVIGAV